MPQYNERIVISFIFAVELRKGQLPEQTAEKFVIDDATKQSTGVVLFDFIAKCVAEFVKKQNITTKLPLGFTFSFPVKQLSLTSGTLIRWTKDFTATGVVGENVVQLLKEAFVRRGVSMCICVLCSLSSNNLLLAVVMCCKPAIDSI